ncbi:C-terminal helicase domain-containing protein, partial [Pseudoalteromonas sp. SIMBA_153]
YCDDFDHKNRLLDKIVCQQDMEQIIIFAATKRSTEKLAKQLQEAGHKASFLHGDLPQSKRNRIVQDLRNGKVKILVATDVAARGLDIPAISHV